MSEKMKTLKEERLISVANVTTGEVKRVSANETDSLFALKSSKKLRMWFPCGKGIWKRFKEMNKAYLVDNANYEMIPINFMQVVSRDKLKKSDHVYADSPDKDSVVILVNIVISDAKAYNRKDLRKWNNITKAKSSPDANMQIVYGDKFHEETILLDLLDEVTIAKPLTTNRLVKGGKITAPITTSESATIRVYDKHLVGVIRRQLDPKRGWNKSAKRGTIIAHDVEARTVTVLMPTKKVTKKTIHQVNA